MRPRYRLKTGLVQYIVQVCHCLVPTGEAAGNSDDAIPAIIEFLLPRSDRP